MVTADGFACVAVGVAGLGAVGGAVHVPVEAVGVHLALLSALDPHRLRLRLRPRLLLQPLGSGWVPGLPGGGCHGGEKDDSR